jgi:putative phosphoesterase
VTSEHRILFALGNECRESQISPQASPQELRTENRQLETAFRIGVISDTHGLLRPEALAALRGSDQIIHAGDIGSPEILQQLAAIAPVSAVRGNVDKGSWALNLHESEVLEVGGVSIYVLHDIAQLDLKPAASGFDVIVYGHSHVPKQEERNGVLYFNPGSAGPRRFKLPVSLGRLVVKNDEVRGELITLALS